MQLLDQYPFLEQPFEENDERAEIEELRVKIEREKQLQEQYTEEMKRLVTFNKQ